MEWTVKWSCRGAGQSGAGTLIDFNYCGEVKDLELSATTWSCGGVLCFIQQEELGFFQISCSDVLVFFKLLLSASRRLI